MKASPAFRPALVMTACAILLSVAGCKIVHDDQLAKSNAAANSSFDPEAFVAGNWETKIVPMFSAATVDVADVLQGASSDLDAAGSKLGRRAGAEGSPWVFVVKGKGTVAAVDTSSRAGTVAVEVPTPGGSRKVTLQIGPVIKGNALRDSLPFFSFQSVTNQLEFAQVGRLLNQRAVERTKGAAAAIKEGGTVEFAGPMSLSSASDAPQVLPVVLKTEGGRSP